MNPCQSCVDNKWSKCGQFPCPDIWLDTKVIGFGTFLTFSIYSNDFILAFKNTESVIRANLSANFMENSEINQFITELYKFANSVGPLSLLSTAEFEILGRKLFKTDEQRFKPRPRDDEFIFVTKGMNSTLLIAKFEINRNFLSVGSRVRSDQKVFS